MKTTKIALTLFSFILLITGTTSANSGKDVKFRYLAPAGTQSVHLTGSFNDWSTTALPMTRASNGYWELTIQLNYGNYEYRFLVDGKHWMRDPLNPDYGGTHSNSIVRVLPDEQPKISEIYPAPGSLLRQSDFSVFAKFKPGKRGAGIDLSSSLLLVDEKAFPLEYSQKTHQISSKIKNLPDGVHRLTIVLYDTAGYATPKVAHIFLVKTMDRPPAAHAGFTRIVAVNQTFSLNAGLSTDPDLEPIRFYDWKILGSPEISGIDSMVNSPFPEIALPVQGYYYFSLQVTAGGQTSQVDTVAIYAFNRQPKITDFVFDAGKYSGSVEKVNLAGEFNQWQPVQSALVNVRDSLWKIQLPMENGEYEYKFVVNETDWIPDPANPVAVSDGWQGVNSVKSVRFPEIPPAQVELVRNERLSLKSVSSPKMENISLRWIPESRESFHFFSDTGESQPLPDSLSRGKSFFKTLHLSPADFSVPQNYYLDIDGENVELINWSESPHWCRDAIIYEIFVRKFTDRGNLAGVRQKLGYLRDLGINCIWLMPIFESPTEHGYGPTQFFKIEQDYGTLHDFRKLVLDAHKMGIRVVLDFIANHTSDQHPCFRAAFQNSKSIFRSWYIWRDDTLRADGLIYDYYNDWDTLPNLNYENPQVWNFMLSVARFWLNQGADGFRCDVAWGVPHQFWKSFRREIKRINPDCLLLNEVLPRSPLYHQDEFDMSYDTDFYGNLLDVMQQKKKVMALDYGLRKTFKNYPKNALSLRYLENHDMERFIKQFGESRTRLAAVLLLTYPGTPLLLYGQEIGLKEKTGKMRWDVENSNLFEFYRKLIKLRRNYPSLRTDEIVKIPSENSQVYAYWRDGQTDAFLVVLNFSDKPEVTTLDLPVDLLEITEKNPFQLLEVLWNSRRDLTDNKFQIGLKPFQPLIFKIHKN